MWSADPRKSMSTRNAGIDGVAGLRTSSRSPTSTGHRGVAAASPDRRSSTGGACPARGRRRRAGATGSATAPAAPASSRTSVRVTAAGVIATSEPTCSRRRPFDAAAHLDRPGAGIERELERAQREAAVDARGGAECVAAVSRRAATSAAGRLPAARIPPRSSIVWLTVKPIFSPR